MSVPSRSRRGAHPTAAIESWSRPSRRHPHAPGAAPGPRRSLLARLTRLLRRR